MTKFTVFFTGGGDAAYEEPATHEIKPNGVLTIKPGDGQRLQYSPNAWHHIADRLPDRGDMNLASRRAGRS